MNPNTLNQEVVPGTSQPCVNLPTENNGPASPLSQTRQLSNSCECRAYSVWKDSLAIFDGVSLSSGPVVERQKCPRIVSSVLAIPLRLKFIPTNTYIKLSYKALTTIQQDHTTDLIATSIYNRFCNLYNANTNKTVAIIQSL